MSTACVVSRVCKIAHISGQDPIGNRVGTSQLVINVLYYSKQI